MKEYAYTHQVIAVFSCEKRDISPTQMQLKYCCKHVSWKEIAIYDDRVWKIPVHFWHWNKKWKKNLAKACTLYEIVITLILKLIFLLLDCFIIFFFDSIVKEQDILERHFKSYTRLCAYVHTHILDL